MSREYVKISKAFIYDLFIVSSEQKNARAAETDDICYMRFQYFPTVLIMFMFFLLF